MFEASDNSPSSRPQNSVATAVSMRGIVKKYGPVTALDGVDFECRRGEIHALLGENGAGKSTLMQTLAGLTRPDSGEIEINGVRATLPSPSAARSLGIGMVQQHFALVPAFTVAENLALDTPSRGFKLYSSKKSAGPALKRASELGWSLPSDELAATLSVGVQQTIEIVKVLAQNPEILIFDEPTATLSGAEIEKLFEVMRALKAEGKAIILIAHKLSEILAVADRVTVLRRGSIVASTNVIETNAKELANWMVGESAADQSRMTLDRGDIASSPALNVEGLTLNGDRGETVLESIGFEASSGEIFGIGGVDGNGQNELAEALTGLRKSANGTICWKAAEFKPGENPSVGYIPQDRRRVGLATTLSVEENLLFEAVNERKFSKFRILRRRALSTLAKDLISKYDIRTASPAIAASALSGGNQQKIVVARALRSEPELIVAVNPTRGLDLGATRFVHEQLNAARSRGACVILISTDLDELALLADRSAILSLRKLTPFSIASGSSTDLGMLLGGVGAS